MERCARFFTSCLMIAALGFTATAMAEDDPSKISSDAGSRLDPSTDPEVIGELEAARAAKLEFIAEWEAQGRPDLGSAELTGLADLPAEDEEGDASPAYDPATGCEDFEGAYPGSYWITGDADSGSGSDYWDDLSCNSHSGGWSGWCSDIGDQADCTTYDNNMEAYMCVEARYWGTSGSGTNRIDYWRWVQMEDGFDTMKIRIKAFSSQPGSGYDACPHVTSATWTLSESTDCGFLNVNCLLTCHNGFCWDNRYILLPASFDPYIYVQVCFVFESDSSVTEEGAYFDDICFNSTSAQRIEPISGGFAGCCATCGDGTCGCGETASNCCQDCAQCCSNSDCSSCEQCVGGNCVPRTTCGDGTCNCGETASSCCQDCAQCCSNSDCSSCEQCVGGSCVPRQTCGDGACNCGETASSCCADCAQCCSNSDCPAGQACTNGICVPDVTCPNGTCDAGETYCNCPQDCQVACGDGCCSSGETSVNCCQDCGASCGDGACNCGETEASCAADCGTGGCGSAPYTIGGAVYSDCANPLSSGVPGVQVSVSCIGGFTGAATTAGGQGLWSLSGVPCETCTVTVTGACSVSGTCPPVPCNAAKTIDVNDANQGPNQSLGFWAEPCTPYDMNGDGFPSIIGDVPCFVSCLYFSTCDASCFACPCSDVTCACDCNGDGFCSLIGDVPCFVDCVYFSSCSATTAAVDGTAETDGFTVGGAVYADIGDPLSTGVPGMLVEVRDARGDVVGWAETSGSAGLWRVDGLTEGKYVVTVSEAGANGDRVLDSMTIVVDEAGQALNQSLTVQYLEPKPTRTDLSRPGKGRSGR